MLRISDLAQLGGDDLDYFFLPGLCTSTNPAKLAIRFGVGLISPASTFAASWATFSKHGRLAFASAFRDPV